MAYQLWRTRRFGLFASCTAATVRRCGVEYALLAALGLSETASADAACVRGGGRLCCGGEPALHGGGGVGVVVRGNDRVTNVRRMWRCAAHVAVCVALASPCRACVRITQGFGTVGGACGDQGAIRGETYARTTTALGYTEIRLEWWGTAPEARTRTAPADHQAVGLCASLNAERRAAVKKM